MHKNYCTPVSRGPSPSIYSSPKGQIYKITGQVVNVRKEPSTESKIVEQVKRGEQYTIVEIKEQGGYKWGKIITPNRQDKTKKYPTSSITARGRVFALLKR